VFAHPGQEVVRDRLGVPSRLGDPVDAATRGAWWVDHGEHVPAIGVIRGTEFAVAIQWR
jgi:hypothetical protein